METRKVKKRSLLKFQAAQIHIQDALCKIKKNKLKVYLTLNQEG